MNEEKGEKNPHQNFGKKSFVPLEIIKVLGFSLLAPLLCTITVLGDATIKTVFASHVI